MMDNKHNSKVPPRIGNVSRLPTAVARNSETMIRSPTRKSSIDPTKDKLAYFKDNVQDPRDQEEDFDPNMYYYHRQEKEALEHQQAAGTPHYTGAFSSSSPVYSVHGSMPPMQLPNAMSSGRPAMQAGNASSATGTNMVTPNVASSNPNMAPNTPLSASFGGTSNVGPTSQYRFSAGSMNGVPITVLGRSNSPATSVGPMGMGGARATMAIPTGAQGQVQGQGQGQGINPSRQPFPRGANMPTASTTIPQAPSSSNVGAPMPSTSISPMRVLPMGMGSSGGLSGGAGMGMAGMGISGISNMGSGMNLSGMNGMNAVGGGMSSLASLGSMGSGMNMGGIASMMGSGSMPTMGMMPQGYTQNIQGMSTKASILKESGNKHIHDGYDQQEDHQDDLGHDHDPLNDIVQTQPSTSLSSSQAQLLRQSINGIPTHSDSFDTSNFPSLSSTTKPPDFSLGEDFSAVLKEMDKTEQHTEMLLPYQVNYPSQLKSSLSHSAGIQPTIQHPPSSPTHSLQQMQTQKMLQSPLKSSIPPPTSPTPLSATHIKDRFGLLGLLSVIRMTDPDLNTLALGTDLTTLGLNLNSPDCLYATFASPFADGPSKREPEFFLPACYYTQPPMQPPSMKMSMFSEETLLYIFYSMPRDMLQLHAAAELHAREWHYHKEHKLWFTRVPGTEFAVKTSSYERGSYYYFDPNTWEKIRKDNFVLPYDQLDTPAPKA